jgi:hypothetical protein
VILQIPDQVIATSFYVSGLGLTRDPYLDEGRFGTFDLGDA